ncbi:MAG TPA: hypothetical protein VFG55_08365, partial [Rhodanobacteraceae bacterium]|nr:hypothetical protein [Rhodanobacteraceae bacterium]
DAAPCVLLTCHWGAGGCVWKLLRARGIHAWFLARRPQVGDLGSGRVSAWYGRLRGWALGRIGSLGPLFTGGSSARVLQALALGQGVVGMLDLPARSAQAGTTLPLLDGTVHFPDGLARLAERAGVGVVLFSCGLDPRNGRRNLRVETLAAGTAANETMRRYAAHLNRRLREESAYWQIWREARTLFVEAADH